MQLRESSATLCIYAYSPLPHFQCITAKIHHQSSTIRSPLLHCCYASLSPQLHNSTSNFPRPSHPSCASASPLLCKSVAIFALIRCHFQLCANPTSILLESVANYSQLGLHFGANSSPFSGKFVAIFVPVGHQFSDRGKKTDSS